VSASAPAQQQRSAALTESEALQLFKLSCRALHASHALRLEKGGSILLASLAAAVLSRSTCEPADKGVLQLLSKHQV
jgi:hypothetical protein